MAVRTPATSDENRGYYVYLFFCLSLVHSSREAGCSPRCWRDGGLTRGAILLNFGLAIRTSSSFPLIAVARVHRGGMTSCASHCHRTIPLSILALQHQDLRTQCEICVPRTNADSQEAAVARNVDG